MQYYEQIFCDFKNLNLGNTKITVALNTLFNRSKCAFMKDAITLLREVNEEEEKTKGLTQEEMKAKTAALKKRILDGESPDDSLVEGFALVREAARRTLNMRHFDVQILGGIVLHTGKISEMTTGEGKTLVATLPLFLNALEGKGCHLVTVNDYLAKRDTQWMGTIYNYLGLSVGCIISWKEAKGPYSASAFTFDPAYLPADSRFLYLRPTDRKDAYNCDITYGVGSEFGFDYLRDNMSVRQDAQVQRELNYAIIDEVDSILIDEARTPLIISGPSEESTRLYYDINNLVKKLNKENDYVLDEEGQSVSLTEEGIHKCERLMGIQNLYDGANTERVHHINQALRAHNFFKRDKEYIVKDGQVIIVDEFTGRIMPGRRWSDGLHQAIEAKEGVHIENENQTLATISFQNYFKLYKKIAGMTGTAVTEAVEFKEIYKTDVVALPTNKRLQRTEYDDEIYKNERDKLNAIVSEIEDLFKEGRPVLAGTVSIEKAEKLSRFLSRKNLPHKVLHGKNHEAEAAIIAQAGKPGAITIATQMAGRGVDIILGGNPEILAREETIRSIWARKQTGKKRERGKQEFADALGEIEERYRNALKEIDTLYKDRLNSLRALLNERERVFFALGEKAQRLFEEAIFTVKGGDAYKRYEAQLLKLRDIHDRAAEDLAEAHSKHGDKQDKLKDFKENAGRTYREYVSLKNSLKERFNIVMDEDVESRRNKLTELLNSAEASGSEGDKRIADLLNLYRESILQYFNILKETFTESITLDEDGLQQMRKKAAPYIEYLLKTSDTLLSGTEELPTIIKEFKEKESRLYSSFLETKRLFEKTIVINLLKEDYPAAEKEYKTSLTEYEKEHNKYDTELRNAREEYEKNRTAYEEEWQRAREELEKTPEEFREVYEELLKQYKSPWVEDHNKVLAAGGLHVIGSERYEARRIDNQLKGRAGRQGDPGSSRFYLSLDDDLLRIFGSERMLGVMEHLPEGETIKHPLINKMLNNAQKRVEGRNFEIRKQLLEFDDVLNDQRKIIYSMRQNILEGQNIESLITEFLEDVLSAEIEESMSLQLKPSLWNLDNFKNVIINTFGLSPDLPSMEEIQNPLFWRDEMQTNLLKRIQTLYDEKKEEAGPYIAEIQRIIMLQVIDNRWKSHLKAIDELRDGISLRAYAQRDPLLAYKHEGYDTFQKTLALIKREILTHLFRVKIDTAPTIRTKEDVSPERVIYSHKTLEQFDIADRKPVSVNNESMLKSANTAISPEEGMRVHTYTAGPKIGRNQPCPCGSGKKYKRCCGKDV